MDSRVHLAEDILVEVEVGKMMDLMDGVASNSTRDKGIHWEVDTEV
jgi:hypothetical protein